MPVLVIEHQGAEHAGVDDMAGRSHDEEVAETLVEDDFGRHSRVRAAEEDGEWPLFGRKPMPDMDILVGVNALARHEPGVPRLQGTPRMLR